MESAISVSMFQSTHPRRVRPVLDRKGEQVTDVSIHAPAWGATSSFMLALPDDPFQSTHPRGVRQTQSARRLQPGLFQSTHPRGVRPGQFVQGKHAFRVSIHAPAWGATSHAVAPLKIRRMFQSTHPRGVRPQPLLDVLERRRRVSIHAPAWGATDVEETRLYGDKLFQSTHPRGVRLDGEGEGTAPKPVSIHAPAWGATSRASTSVPCLLCFNPRTRVGCDCFHVLSSRFP